MTDLQKAIYLGENVGEVIHFYHRLNGDSTVKIISVNPTKRTFEYTFEDCTPPSFTMSFDEVLEFGFRNNGVPPNMI